MPLLYKLWKTKLLSGKIHFNQGTFFLFTHLCFQTCLMKSLYNLYLHKFALVKWLYEAWASSYHCKRSWSESRQGGAMVQWSAGRVTAGRPRGSGKWGIRWRIRQTDKASRRAVKVLRAKSILWALPSLSNLTKSGILKSLGGNSYIYNHGLPHRSCFDSQELDLIQASTGFVVHSLVLV